MKKLMKYASLFFIGAAVVLSSCKKDEDPTPDANPNAKVFTNVMTSTNTGGLVTVGTVTTSDDVVKLRLEVTGANNLDKIYVMLSEDNAAFQPISVPTITNSYGTFTGGSSSYTLDVPNLQSFIVDIPVSVRTSPAAVNDVYQIWITNGTGAFTKPTKNRDLGIATINLKYTAAAPDETFATATVDLGSQSSNDYGSLLVTSGQVSAFLTADYNDAPESADIRFATLTGGKKDNNSTSLWLYSPADIETANPAVSGQANFALPATGTSRTTYFVTYSGGTSFDNVTVSTLSGLTIGTTNKSIQVSAGNVYAFQTQSGKKGLIKINSSGATTNFVGTGSTTAQNMNVTVKVLN